MILAVALLATSVVSYRWLGAIGVDSNFRRVQAQAQITSFVEALQEYKADVGRFPTSAEGLKALRHDPRAKNWKGPYLPNDVPLDPWGRPYIFVCDDCSVPKVISYGADGREGGTGRDADILSFGGPGLPPR